MWHRNEVIVKKMFTQILQLKSNKIPSTLAWYKHIQFYRQIFYNLGTAVIGTWMFKINIYVLSLKFYCVDWHVYGETTFDR